MKKLFRPVLTFVLVAAMILSMGTAALASGTENLAYSDNSMLATKTSQLCDDGNYKIRLKVPGDDGSNLHDEVIMMVDGSYSGDDEWNSMVNTIVTIGETVLNGNGNTQLTLMAFGMGDNPVLVHAKTVNELRSVLGSLPGSLLYGRSSTNNEAGFTGVAEYIASHDDTLNEVHVFYISDGEVNTDETPANFYDWKNNGWHRFAEDLIITANFEAECGAIMEGANRSNAFLTVFGDGDVETILANATYEMMDTYNGLIWADVYAQAGLAPDGLYPVSDVERAFVDYDNTHNTYIQDNFYYALVGRSYPNRTARTVAAASALAAMNQVTSLYIIDSNGTTGWMTNIPGAEFVPAGSIANILPSLGETLTNLAKTPLNDVVISDYMSKWVLLNPESLAVVDDTTGAVIWNAMDGWAIAEELRPTDAETPVLVEEVNPNEYARGGSDTSDNGHGEIYKLTWYVKDGALLRSENYHLEYTVQVDTLEPGFCVNVDYPANGDTAISYTDENGDPHSTQIDVPTVETPASYLINVKYVDKDTGEEIARQVTVSDIPDGNSYDVTQFDAINIPGYVYDSTEGDALVGIMDSNKEITVYYSRLQDYVFSFRSGEASNVSFLYLDKETGKVIFDHKVDIGRETSFTVPARSGHISVVFVKQAKSGMLWTSEEVDDSQLADIIASVKRNNKSYKGYDAYAYGKGDHDLTYSIGNKKSNKTQTVTYSFQ